MNSAVPLPYFCGKSTLMVKAFMETNKHNCITALGESYAPRNNPTASADRLVDLIDKVCTISAN